VNVSVSVAGPSPSGLKRSDSTRGVPAGTLSVSCPAENRASLVRRPLTWSISEPVLWNTSCASLE
jgi:hypothetical protein